MMMEKIEFWTDGACSGNPGPGGYGVVMTMNDKVMDTLAYHCEETTNNRMELSAILYVMENFGKSTKAFDVYSDSAYAINTYTSWMFNWQRNGWIKSDKKTPENLDIIKKYYDLYEQGYRINLHKVKGHSTNKFNNMADELATGKLQPLNYWMKLDS